MNSKNSSNDYPKMMLTSDKKNDGFAEALVIAKVNDLYVCSSDYKTTDDINTSSEFYVFKYAKDIEQPKEEEEVNNDSDLVEDIKKRIVNLTSSAASLTKEGYIGDANVCIDKVKLLETILNSVGLKDPSTEIKKRINNINCKFKKVNNTNGGQTKVVYISKMCYMRKQDLQKMIDTLGELKE